jgi:hypothetical protein
VRDFSERVSGTAKAKHKQSTITQSPKIIGIQGLWFIKSELIGRATISVASVMPLKKNNDEALVPVILVSKCSKDKMVFTTFEDKVSL